MPSKLGSHAGDRIRPKILRCFVAMAFGHGDTDAVYDKWIKKAIRAAGLAPIRVDRIIHIDRVDSKIRGEIKKADVVVADLTYTRPSVYWEAGFAERESPVIYTCRSDHLRDRPDDDFGNFRVHFDLRNANIITWSGEGSKTFAERLCRTLKHAIAPIRRRVVGDELVTRARAEFAGKAMHEQRKLINEASLLELLSLGYRLGPLNLELSMKIERGVAPSFRRALWKVSGSTVFLVTEPFCLDVLQKSGLEMLYLTPDLWGIRELVSRKDLDAIIAVLGAGLVRAVRRIILLPVLGSVPATRVSSALPSWRRLGSALHYFNPQLETSRRLDLSKPSSAELVIIDRIQSPEEYRTELKRMLAEAEMRDEPIMFPHGQIRA